MMKFPRETKSINFEGWELVVEYISYSFDDCEIEDIYNEKAGSVYDYWNDYKILGVEEYFYKIMAEEFKESEAENKIYDIGRMA